MRMSLVQGPHGKHLASLLRRQQQKIWKYRVSVKLYLQEWEAGWTLPNYGSLQHFAWDSLRFPGARHAETSQPGGGGLSADPK